jgi:hypothetical protein
MEFEGDDDYRLRSFDLRNRFLYYFALCEMLKGKGGETKSGMG